MGILRAGALPGLHMQPTAQVINGSLKFERTASNYLSRTFSAGNRKTFTVSFWHKHSNHSEGASVGSGGGRIFSAGTTGAGARAQMGFSGPTNGSDEDNFSIGFNATGSTWKSLNSDAFFRDFSAWQHFVIAVDCTLSEPNRVKFYCNGVEKTLSGSFPGDENQALNNNVGHAIGRYNPEGTDYYSGLLSNFYHIDGLYLGPEYFGFTDPLTGTWRPKKFRAVGTTVNDGTDWSANFSGNGGTQPSTAFDGNGPRQNGYVHSGSELTVNFSPPLSGHIVVYGGTGAGSHNSTTTDTFTLSDGSVLSSQEKYDVAPYFNALDFGEKKNITSLVCSAGYTLYAVSVDGVFLKDSTTQNLDFGTNGFYLPMDNEDDFAVDKSGKGNNWTQNNFSGTSVDPDILKDSPSGAVSGGRAQTGITTTSSAPGNYCTWNHLRKGNLITLSDGNLQAASTSGSKDGVFGTIGVSSGKYYWEVELTATDGNTNAAIGVALGTLSPDAASPTSAGAYFYSSYNGNKWLSSADSSYGASYTTGDVVGVALDLDNTTLTFYKNGTSQGNATTSLPSGTYMPYVGDNANNGVQTVVGNWGQKPFKYAPPQGFLPLNSASVRPETTIPRPDQYVGVATYTGSGNTSQDIIFGFKPDFAWTKSRSTAENHGLFDSVRGLPKFLRSDSTDNEYTLAVGTPVSFISNGINFTNGSGEINESTRSYVAWAWKAGGSSNTFNIDDVGYASAAAAGLTGGDITPSGASVGTKQGFSIIQYAGTDNASAKTIPHGLLQKPDFMIVKQLTDDSTAWTIYHSSLGATKYLEFDTDAVGTATGPWNDTEPTSSLFTVGSSYNNTNRVSRNFVSYHWHNVPGLQKFGSYTYTSNRPFFVELGFKPAILWLKRTGSGSATNISYGSWFVADKERGKFNPVSYTESQWLNRSKESGKRGDSGTSAAGTYLDIDLVSNGFVIPTTGGGAEFNQPSDVVVYCAWAEAPASNLFGGQSNAR